MDVLEAGAGRLPHVVECPDHPVGRIDGAARVALLEGMLWRSLKHLVQAVHRHLVPLAIPLFQRQVCDSNNGSDVHAPVPPSRRCSHNPPIGVFSTACLLLREGEGEARRFDLAAELEDATDCRSNSSCSSPGKTTLAAGPIFPPLPLPREGAAPAADSDRSPSSLPRGDRGRETGGLTSLVEAEAEAGDADGDGEGDGDGDTD